MMDIKTNNIFLTVFVFLLVFIGLSKLSYALEYDQKKLARIHEYYLRDLAIEDLIAHYMEQGIDFETSYHLAKGRQTHPGFTGTIILGKENPKSSK